MPSPEPTACAAELLASTEADDAARELALAADRHWQASLAPATAGLSPVALGLAMTDWALNLAVQPAQALWLAQQLPLLGLRAAAAALAASSEPAMAGTALRGDASGQGGPASALRWGHAAAQAWWQQATALPGMQPHHRALMAFFARQWLDVFDAASQPAGNPQFQQATWRTAGGNLVAGAGVWLDRWRVSKGLPPLAAPAQQFQPGVSVATTPGKVVHRNHLIELIQYLPTTDAVHAEPVLIVPSWIMKYYILDLSPHNSLVRWLVAQGHTVFILSWRNPDAADAELGMADYLALGVFDALAAIARLVPGAAVHACGYCLGGTLLALAAAAIGRPNGVARADALAPLCSLSLLAAETDFSEPGELGLLIDEAQVSWLEAMMAARGYLTGPQMAGSFAFLHARDQVWSRRLRELWLGEPDQPSDLMAWNADLTRMPAAMHAEYLRRCYLRNEIAEGRFPVEGEPVSLSDLRQPLFVVATETDHVSPWPSVYKIHRLTANPVCFVLTNGGHNAGIVSQPGHARRHFWLRTRQAGGGWVAPAHWVEGAERHEGSWWPAWHAWLLGQGSAALVPPRWPAAELEDAPGRHVLVRYVDPVPVV